MVCTTLSVCTSIKVLFLVCLIAFTGFLWVEGQELRSGTNEDLDTSSERDEKLLTILNSLSKQFWPEDEFVVETGGIGQEAGSGGETEEEWEAGRRLMSEAPSCELPYVDGDGDIHINEGCTQATQTDPVQGGDLDASEEEWKCEDAEEVVEDDKCYALVMAGGGNRGSFQAGAIKGLVEKYKAKGQAIKWDVVGGVSVGALNAYTSRYYEPGNEGEWADNLVDIWLNKIKQSDVSNCSLPLTKNIPRWVRLLASSFIPGRKVASFCSHVSIADFAKRTFEGLTPSPDRGLTLMGSRLNDMQAVSFTEQRTESELLRAVLASSAVPIVFPPIEVVEGSGNYLYDGGVISNANIAAAVVKCMDKKKVTADKVIVDYIDTSPKSPIEFSYKPGKFGFFKLFMRTFDMMFTKTAGEHCIARARGIIPGFQVRHFVQPTHQQLIDSGVTSNILNVTDKHVLERLAEFGNLDGAVAKCYRRSA